MRKSLYSALGVAFLGTPGKAPSGMFPAFFAPLLVEAGLAPAGGLVAGAVGGLVFGFFGAGSASDWHAAGRLIIVPGPALSLSIRPAAKAEGEMAAGGIEAAGVGADCSGMVTDCSGEGSISGSIMAAALGEPYIVQHGEGATARNCKQNAEFQA